MKFFLRIWNTNQEDKCMCDFDHRHEYLGNQKDIWALWFMLKKENKKLYVEVYNLEGVKQKPEIGLHGLQPASFK